MERGERPQRENGQNYDGQNHSENRRASSRCVSVNLRVVRSSSHVIAAIALLAHVACIGFNGLLFFKTDAPRVRPHEAAIKYSTGQTFIVVTFDSFEVAN